MEPINYFFKLEEAENNFIAAFSDNLKRLRAVKEMGLASVIIVNNNYHTKLLSLFVRESQDNQDDKIKNLFFIFSKSIERKNKVLESFAENYKNYSEKIDIVIGILEIEDQQKRSKAIKSFRQAIKKNNLFKEVLKKVETMTDEIFPYFEITSEIISIAEVFFKESSELFDKCYSFDKSFSAPVIEE